ncbi:MAG TPA: hypothetical protein PKD85_18190, partial [Saprospiraceae bacterium]|nr:hypothetical protein [Saprospiraceae bacterium]
MNKHVFLTFIVGLLYLQNLQSQTLQPLPLNDLSSFKSQAGNWSIVGDVMMDPSKDVNTTGNEGIKAKDGTGILL